MFEQKSSPFLDKKITGSQRLLEDVRDNYISDKNLLNRVLDVDALLRITTLLQEFSQTSVFELKFDQVNQFLDRIISEVRKIGILDLSAQMLFYKAKFNFQIGNLYYALKDMFNAKFIYSKNRPNLDFKLKLCKYIGKIYMDVTNSPPPPALDTQDPN